MKLPYLLILFFFVLSCDKDETIDIITNSEDYNGYLYTTTNSTFESAKSEKEFWSNRLRKDSSGVGDLGPLANAYAAMFTASGEVLYLKNAEIIYRKAIKISAHSKDSYIRSLAQNLISQHRFVEAKKILEESLKGASNKRAIQHILFDVYMELGEYKTADKTLLKLKNKNDYNYLIRLAKRNDHKGNLEGAIQNLTEAMKIADSRKSKTLQIWTYTNLADFYGHSGQIKKAYNLYLKTLKIQSDNNYAKKQIAWILYSYEKNPLEANSIIDSIMVNNKSPEYYLFKADLADFDGNTSGSNKFKEKFIKSASNEDYGIMYTSYLIELYSETNPKLALELAIQEVNNRATPETYSLLAYSQLINGDKSKALLTIEKYVIGKTFEPKSLYYSAIIYKENKNYKKEKELNDELLKAAFELGPLIMNEL
ncbi:MAG: hypothetical protein QM499_10020 [Flavobacteriaceae bacterium]